MEKYSKEYYKIKKTIESLEDRVEKYERNNNCILKQYIDMFTLEFYDYNTEKIFRINIEELPE